MKVLITGGAGFIGTNLVFLLRKERPEWNLHVLDLLTYAGNYENIASLVKEEEVAFSRIDLCDSESVQSLLKKEAFDIVFHLAAESHVDRSLYAASTFASTNVLGTQHLIDGALANSCRRFIHVSTDEVYGSMDEDQRADEQYPLLPSSPYSASKAASDLMVLAAHRTHGLPAVVTRCTNNYGGYQFPEKFIPLFITRAMQDERLPVYGDGLQQRSWIHTDDHCRAILSLAESSVVGEVFNIGGPRESERTNISVAQEILRILGKDESLLEHVTDRPAHDRKYAVESRALSELTGWKPEVEFQEGLEKTVAWYQEHEGWWRAITSGEYQRFYEQHYVGQ